MIPRRSDPPRKVFAAAAAAVALSVLYPFAAGPAYYLAERGWLPWIVVDLFRPAEFAARRTPFGDRYVGWLFLCQEAAVGDRIAAGRGRGSPATPP